MTDPYPYAPPPAPPAPPPQPATIAQAVRLMYVAAGIEILSTLIVLLDFDEVRAGIRASLRDSGVPETDISDGLVSGLLWGGIGMGVAIALGLWVWMAIKIGQGRAWARVLGTVFYVIAAFSFLGSFIGTGVTGMPETGGPIGLAFAAAVFALETYILVLIWRKESTAYIDAVSAYRLRSRGLY